MGFVNPLLFNIFRSKTIFLQYLCAYNENNMDVMVVVNTNLCTVQAEQTTNFFNLVIPLWEQL